MKIASTLLFLLTILACWEDVHAIRSSSRRRLDLTPPDLQCTDNSVASLDGSGIASYNTAPGVLYTASDDSGATPTIVFTEPEPFDGSNTYTCDDIGVQEVEVEATDGSGNMASCDSSFIVEDAMVPTAACTNPSVDLVDSTIAIPNEDFDGGSTDNCGIQSVTASQTTFGCSDVGSPVTVTVTALDTSGNTATCDSMVTVTDITAPTVTCMTGVEIELTGSPPEAPLMDSDFAAIDDNCPGSVLAASTTTTLTCADVSAEYAVSASGTDAGGLSGSCSGTIRVFENEAPTAVCAAPLAIALTSSSEAITVSDIDDGSDDNCGAENLEMTIDKDTFTCADVGVSGLAVVLTVTDGSGNSASCTTDVTVTDVSVPTPLCKDDVLVELDASGNGIINVATMFAGISDNCQELAGFPVFKVDASSITCGESFTVSLMAEDVSGNDNSCQGTVIASDTMGPVAVCNPQTVDLGASGSASIDPSLVSASDNCSAEADITITPPAMTMYGCAEFRASSSPTETFTFEDEAGNTSTCDVVVTITDSENVCATAAPTAAPTEQGGSSEENSYFSIIVGFINALIDFFLSGFGLFS